MFHWVGSAVMGISLAGLGGHANTMGVLHYRCPQCFRELTHSKAVTPARLVHSLPKPYKNPRRGSLGASFPLLEMFLSLRSFQTFPVSLFTKASFCVHLESPSGMRQPTWSHSLQSVLSNHQSPASYIFEQCITNWAVKCLALLKNPTSLSTLTLPLYV